MAFFLLFVYECMLSGCKSWYMGGGEIIIFYEQYLIEKFRPNY